MSRADDIVKSGKTPTALKDAAEEVADACKSAYAQLESEPDDSPIHTTHKNHGLHAYRYEEQKDGSVVVLWANAKSGNVKLKAFDSIEDASRWSPRDERG